MASASLIATSRRSLRSDSYLRLHNNVVDLQEAVSVNMIGIGDYALGSGDFRWQAIETALSVCVI